jgi:hypothetical protein
MHVELYVAPSNGQVNHRTTKSDARRSEHTPQPNALRSLHVAGRFLARASVVVFNTEGLEQHLSLWHLLPALALDRICFLVDSLVNESNSSLIPCLLSLLCVMCCACDILPWSLS